jgi:hypothetical protein
MTTVSSATRAGRGLPVPGAFPRAGAWSPMRPDGGNAARRRTAEITALGQPPTQRKHAYMDKARRGVGDNDLTGSHPRRAPV